MYRLLVLALVLTLTVAFSGCGAKQDTTEPAEGTNAVSTPDDQPAADDNAAAPAAGSATEKPAEEEADAEDTAEESWDEFEVVPSASASAQKKE